MTRIEEERIDEMLANEEDNLRYLKENDWGIGHIRACEQRIAIITELKELRAQGGVRVKRLEWKTLTPGFSLQRATCLLGDYRVWEDGDGAWAWSLNDEKHSDGTEETPDAAKAAAFADYRSRILSALETEAVEPVAWLASNTQDGVNDITIDAYMAAVWEEDGFTITPLFAHPPHSSIPTVTDAMVERAWKAQREYHQSREISYGHDGVRAGLIAALSEESKP